MKKNLGRMESGKAASRDWYGLHWKSLRSNLIKSCVRNATDFFDQLQSEAVDVDEVSAAFFDSMLERVSLWIREDGLGLWQNALPLFANKARFSDWVRRDIDALSGAKVRNGQVVSKKQALGQILWQFFELGRRELEAMDRGVSVARIKTWERLDKISRRLAAEPPITEMRCAEGHFSDLSVFIKKHHETDRNLPRKPSKIREYFYEFSDSCFELGISENLRASNDHIEDEWGHLSPSQEVDVTNALGALTNLERACLDIEFGTKLCSITFTSKEAFMADNQLSAKGYQAMLEDVLDRALPLVQAMAAEGFGRG